MIAGRDVAIRTIRFQKPERLAMYLPERYGSDFVWVNMRPSPDERPRAGRDEWGAVWSNIGISNLGEVKEFPLTDWSSLNHLAIPEVNDPSRWAHLEGVRKQFSEKFIIGTGISIYERVHFLRGLANAWADIYCSQEKLRALLDILVKMNLAAIRHYAALGTDGYFFTDDWGLQNKLMISPDKWREIWKPCYEKIYAAAHEAGMFTFLHSCGYIVDILDDLIEVGLDVIQMDQQQNMGLELLGERFAGRITFFCPVDIQNVMVYGSPDAIRAYCRRMVALLGRPEGGFIAMWYSDPAGAGHTQEAIDSMCDEFLKISEEISSSSFRYELSTGTSKQDGVE
jgi:uroporphyrinogen decarboxylase